MAGGEATKAHEGLAMTQEPKYTSPPGRLELIADRIEDAAQKLHTASEESTFRALAAEVRALARPDAATAASVALPMKVAGCEQSHPRHVEIVWAQIAAEVLKWPIDEPAWFWDYIRDFAEGRLIAAPARTGGEEPVACRLCDAGFPLKPNGYRRGTQSLGMIPDTRCAAASSEVKGPAFTPTEPVLPSFGRVVEVECSDKSRWAVVRERSGWKTWPDGLSWSLAHPDIMGWRNLPKGANAASYSAELKALRKTATQEGGK